MLDQGAPNSVFLGVFKIDSKFSYDVILVVFYLTNRFHFAVRLFSYRSQMTSKCGKNKKVAHEPLGEWVTDVLTTF